jgi:hypothetical protein
MILSDRMLGISVTRQIRERNDSALLTIGNDRFTRVDLAGVTCFNYIAAANLSAAIATFKVANTRDLFNRIAPAALALPRVGAIALAVLGAAFEAKGIGIANGASPLETWARRHTANKKEPETAIVTFHTIKTREAAAAKQERRAARKGRRPAPSTAPPSATDARSTAR